jgi:16S rRNA (cytosine1402-N4)-methyltransferase
MPWAVPQSRMTGGGHPPHSAGRSGRRSCTGVGPARPERISWVRRSGVAPANAHCVVSEPTREHEPVLVAPLLRLLDPQPGQIVLDGTVGLGGHAAALLPRLLPGGRYIGLDVDAEMLAVARTNLANFPPEAVRLAAANYADFARELTAAGVTQVDHVLLDLGVNSAQIDDAGRGFSFDRDGPLDMRFDRNQRRQALDLVNALPESELADLFYEYGQEGQSRKIAKRICEVRHSGRITTTRALAAAVESAGGPGGRIHPATRVFQALRIAVNRELDNLEAFLREVTAWVRPGGRLAVISFHSLEDSIVKTFLRAAKAAGTFTELTKRPVIAEPEERGRNPRSRSAKLRVAERLAAAT